MCQYYSDDIIIGALVQWPGMILYAEFDCVVKTLRFQVLKGNCVFNFCVCVLLMHMCDARLEVIYEADMNK